MPTERDRKHAELLAGFLSNLAVASIAGAMLQIILFEAPRAAASMALLLIGVLVYGVAHVALHRAYEPPP